MVDAGPNMVLQRCVIGRWKGYRTVSFLALLEDGTPIAESSSFHVRRAETSARTEAAVQAYEALARELVDLGWRLDDSSGPDADAWYATAFLREVEALPDEPAEADVEPETTEPKLLPQPLPPAPIPALVPVLEVARPVEPAKPTPALDRPLPASGRGARVGGRTIRATAALGLAVAVSLTVFVALGHGLRQTEYAAAQPPARPHVVAKRRQAPHASPVRRRAVASARLAVPATPVARLVISAPVVPSWLEVHLGSARGRILFAGELPPGKTLRLHGPRLWVRFGAAGHLSIKWNGRTIPLNGTCERTFGPRL